MGSFQQITMGIGCLIAAFWFGSILQDRPAGQNQTTNLLPDGTIDPHRTDPSPNLMARTKGFLDSMFESPSKAKPTTVADLRQNSQLELPSLPNLVDDSHGLAPAQSHSQRLASTENLASENPLSTSDTDIVSLPQRFVGSFQPSGTTETSGKVVIVPDFSSLADEVNRGLSFNSSPAINDQNLTPGDRSPDNSSIELIPVPQFSEVAKRKPEPINDPNWDLVRKQVAAAENRLKNYRVQMSQPIPDIVDSVNQSTREFWDRQQSEARRQQPQPSRLVANQRPFPTQQQRRKPETWSEKQDRWDVFSEERDGGALQRQTQNHPIAEPPMARPRDVQRSYRDEHSYADAATSQPKPRGSIVEVNRPFISQQPHTEPNSSARVRSLNDDRIDSPYVEPANERVAYNTHQSPQATEVQNQLRPRYNPTAGSKPEFVSPPDYGQFSPQPNSSTSEIVKAAKVTYGSFREYQTQPQDTLQTISEKFYGSADYYFDLYLANRDQLSNPATVPVGMTIKIPKFDAR